MVHHVPVNSSLVLLLGPQKNGAQYLHSWNNRLWLEGERERFSLKKKQHLHWLKNCSRRLVVEKKANAAKKKSMGNIDGDTKVGYLTKPMQCQYLV